MQRGTMSKRILLVATSHDRLGQTDKPSGVWLDELAQAFFVFRDSGARISLASSKGGRIPLDPASCQDPWLSESGKEFLNDPQATQLAAASQMLTEVDSDQVDGLYIVGGAGAMTDLPKNQALGRLLAALAVRRRPVAAVCHGVAGLAAARYADGTPLIAKRQVTGFSNAEEEQVGNVQQLEVLPEDLLRSLGAVYSCADPWLEHVVVDGVLLTGQNPASARLLAQRLIEVLAAESLAGA
jgi:putative intracellular protease/amidase